MTAPAAPVQWTVLDVIKWTAARFGERGIASPRLDAELLVAQVLALPRVQLYVQSDRPLAVDELAAIRALIKRRQAGESVAYLVGKKEFWGFEFAVDARVLVPRPDTETLVDEARERLTTPEPSEGSGPSTTPEPSEGSVPSTTPEPSEGSGPSTTPEPSEGSVPPAMGSDEQSSSSPTRSTDGLRIADVGTGSGAIAVTLAKLFPAAALFAVDVSPGALEVARGNAERLGAEVTFLEGDLAAPLAPHAPFSAIVANLPYIPSADMAELPADVKTEPAVALDGGPDGLALVRRLVAAAPALLAPGGTLVLEIGAGQADMTAALLRDADFTDVRSRRDLAGIERVVSGVRP